MTKGVVLPFFLLDLPIFRLQSGPPGGEFVHLGPEPLGGGQGYGVQAFQLPCRSLEQDDLALMPSEEFLLVPGLAVFLIQGTELAIGGSVLHGEGQLLHFLCGGPEIRLYPGGSGRRPVAPLGQFLIAGDPMFGQEVQCFSGPLQILDGCPMFVSGTLLGFDIVLDVDEQAGPPGALFRLAGRVWPAGDPGSQGLLGVVGTQGFQSCEPLLARSPGGYVLAPFQLVPFPLEAAEQVLQVGAAGQEPVNDGTQLRLVAGAVLFRLMLNVAFSLVPAGNDDRQTNIVAFTQHSVWVEITWVVLLLLLIVACGCVKSAGKLAIAFGICLALQYYILPNSPKILASSFTIIVSYARKIFPCLIVGAMILQKTPVRELMVALRKWHIPQSLIIPLSVTIRYFPALKEEAGYIRDAMKLRNVRGVQKIECLLVPTMISATTTAEELSAAAVTRGIENPASKTSMIEMKFGVQDFLCLAAGLIFCVISIMVG